MDTHKELEAMSRKLAWIIVSQATALLYLKLAYEMGKRDAFGEAKDEFRSVFAEVTR